MGKTSIPAALSAMLWLLSTLPALTLSGFANSRAAHAQEDPDQMFEDDAEPGMQVAAAREVLKQTLPPGAGREEEIRYLLQRERAAFTVGAGRIRLESLRRLVELHKDTPQIQRFLGYLWREEWRSGNQQRAFEIGIERVSSKDLALHIRIENAALLAGDYLTLHQQREAWETLETAERLQAEYAHASDQSRADRVTTAVELTRATLLRVEGRYTEAEVAIRKARESAARAVDRTRDRKVTEGFISLHESNLRYQYSAQGRHANLLASMGRHVEAETVARQGLQDAIANQTHGATLGYWHWRIAQTLLVQRQYAHALVSLEQALNIYAQTGLNPSSERVIRARMAKLQALLGLDRWADADSEYESMLSATADDAIARQLVNTPLLRAVLHAMNGRTMEAAKVIDGSVRFRARLYGEKNPATIEAKAVQAMVLQAQEQTHAALSAYRYVFEVIFSDQTTYGDTAASGLREFYLPLALRNYLKLVADQAKSGQANAELISDAFVVADRLRDSVVQRAVIDSAARAVVTDNPELSAIIRKEQDLRLNRQRTYSEMNKQFAIIRDADQTLREIRKITKEADASQEKKLAATQELRKSALKALKALRQQAATSENEQRNLRQELTQRFPAYQRLVNPLPARPADVARRLDTDEVLVSVYTTAEHSFVWAIPARGEAFLHVAPVGAAAISADVAKLRSTLELGNRTSPAPYDFDAAHRLYSVLLQPVARTWAGARTITVVASGDLGRIPFAVLVKEPAARGAYETAAWLIRDMAIGHVASASAWLAVRDAAGKTAGVKPFIGFGDPQFSSRPATAPGKAVRATVAAALYDRSVDNPAEFDYGTIPSLPETRDEIISIAKSLNADPVTSTFFGSAASRAQVMKTSLQDYRIIAFATHGLRAGDLPNLSQPALAMATTDNPSESPLLALDDVLKLKLGADWVVLSACNTAAPDGSSGEAISGLGRGFFFAGARAMLVTHWAVESLSAQALVATTFQHYAKRTASRAESLRLAQLELLAGKAGVQYRHPFFWSPYALIGDPIR